MSFHCSHQCVIDDLPGVSLYAYLWINIIFKSLIAMYDTKTRAYIPRFECILKKSTNQLSPYFSGQKINLTCSNITMYKPENLDISNI